MALAQLAQPMCQPPAPAHWSSFQRLGEPGTGQQTGEWGGRALMGWHKPGPGQGFAELSIELCLFQLGPDNVQKPALISLGFYNSTLNDSKGRDTSSYSQMEKPPDYTQNNSKRNRKGFAPFVFPGLCCNFHCFHFQRLFSSQSDCCVFLPSSPHTCRFNLFGFKLKTEFH